MYNAHETGLDCKALPSRLLAPRRKNAFPGYKVSKTELRIWFAQMQINTAIAAATYT